MKVRATVYRSTTEEEEEEDFSSTSVSEYDPQCDMSSMGGDPNAEAEMESRRIARQSTLDRRVKALKARHVGKKKTGTGTSGVASPCVTSDDVFIVPAPIPAASRGKSYKTPTSYDVDKCAKWTVPPHVSDVDRVGLEGLPRLPRPWNSHGFGVIGTGADYARDVVAPYMIFDGDTAKLEKESSSANFDSMLEHSTELLARLSFGARAMANREANFAERESAWEKRAADREVEVGRLRHDLEESENQRKNLVTAVGASFDRGMREGELGGWREAVRAYKDAGYLDEADVDKVVCHLVSDGEDDYMDDGGDGAGDGELPSAAAS